MKKIMIASDIHGSAYYCRKLLERYEAEKPDRLVLLGDILYHGPRNDLPKEYAPKEVIAMLNPLRNEIICVRGNCDTEVDQMVLDFNVLAEQAYLNFNDRSIVLAHAAGTSALSGRLAAPLLRVQGRGTSGQGQPQLQPLSGPKVQLGGAALRAVPGGREPRPL